MLGEGSKKDDARAKALKAEGHYGATSEYLAPKDTYFNILYSHPLYGAMPQWGEVQQRIKANDPAALQPPVNSKRGGAVDPAIRRQCRVHWGPTRGSAFPRLHQTEMLPCSPTGRHPAPTPELPSIDHLGEQVPYHQTAPESTDPWKRNPPHTEKMRQLYERMYGPEKKSREPV
mmetsp:Transcript_7910/g.20680  ORF Transcript_7910/g.20680 Transcript_7910/m.20680 type:complete len:174 (-) Transcript_7910:115-636(-)